MVNPMLRAILEFADGGPFFDCTFSRHAALACVKLTTFCAAFFMDAKRYEQKLWRNPLCFHTNLAVLPRS
jgi:hypothetical protein